MVFITINLPHLDLDRSGILSPSCTDSRKFDLAKQKGKFQIEVGSVDCFPNCSRVMVVVVVSLLKNQTLMVVFEAKQRPKCDIGINY